MNLKFLFQNEIRGFFSYQLKISLRISTSCETESIYALDIEDKMIFFLFYIFWYLF